MINLDQVQMNVTKTARNGVVNAETLFYFEQREDVVYARYSGGKIAKGFLVGQLTGAVLKFSYCQLQLDGKLDNGESVCELSLQQNGKIKMTESFEWNSRPDSKGVNVFEEI